MEDILAITFIFGGGSVFLLAISPIGRAIADRIRSKGGVDDAMVEDLQETQQDIVAELEHLRGELTDVQERLDFTERMLANSEAAKKLPDGDVPN